MRPVPSATAAARARSGAWPPFLAVRAAGMTVATVRSLPRPGTAIAPTGTARRTVVASILRRRLALGRALLSNLIARLLPLGRRHPAPPLHVALEALALIGAHRLIALEPLAKELLLLEREPLESLVGRVQLALPLRRERLEALEIFLHAGAIGG